MVSRLENYLCNDVNHQPNEIISIYSYEPYFSPPQLFTYLRKKNTKVF